MLSHPQVIGFSSETVAAFIAVVGILSILAQVLKKYIFAVKLHVIWSHPLHFWRCSIGILNHFVYKKQKNN